MDAAAIDLQLPSGSLHAERVGPRGGPAVLCVPGLSANLRSFDAVAAALARAGRDVVALDLRGRGLSPATAPGTHGWLHHAEDVLGAAARLGLERFDLVGHSMGAFVAMQAAALAPEQVRRVVLVDGIGPPEPAAIPPILASIRRLGAVFPSADAYWTAVRGRGVFGTAEALWEAHARYELEIIPGGVRSRTSALAVMEDVQYAAEHDARAFWQTLRQPTLLVRASQPLPPTDGHIVGPALRDAFLAAVPSARAVEVDATHYSVIAHPDALGAMCAFLSPPGP